MSKTEPGSSHVEQIKSNADALAWLDGIAGRDASCEVSKDGARLREALLETTETATQPPWSQIERLAATPPATLQTSALEPDKELVARPASNQSFFRNRYGWAASIAICAVFLLNQWPHGDDDAQQFRGAGVSSATLRTATPSETAENLVNELRALGANVNSKQESDEVLLEIVVPASAVAEVNRRLQTFETGLGVDGKLLLHVSPLPK
jgi:hypothetical protein